MKKKRRKTRDEDRRDGWEKHKKIDGIRVNMIEEEEEEMR